MLDDPPRLRPIEDADRFLLRTATLLNLNWSGERFDYATLDAHPLLPRYYSLRAGDLGLVSTGSCGEATGVVWVRQFSADDPGYGFVRDDVPELSLCVLPGYRGAGVGSTLLTAAVAEARERHLSGISLSVEAGNPARRLYERAGFAPAAGASEGTLLLDLAVPSDHS